MAPVASRPISPATSGEDLCERVLLSMESLLSLARERYMFLVQAFCNHMSLGEASISTTAIFSCISGKISNPECSRREASQKGLFENLRMKEAMLAKVVVSDRLLCKWCFSFQGVVDQFCDQGISITMKS